MSASELTRRDFLTLASGLAIGVLSGGRRFLGAAVPSPVWEHPDPRPDIDGSKVLTAEALSGTPHVIPIYDGIREIPHIADGIRCHCGCAGAPGYRSLLSCYEGGRMATYCDICQGQGELAVRRHAEGQTLDQIRRAVDARFGPRGGQAMHH